MSASSRARTITGTRGLSSWTCASTRTAAAASAKVTTTAAAREMPAATSASRRGPSANTTVSPAGGGLAHALRIEVERDVAHALRVEQAREALAVASVAEDDDVALGLDRLHRDAMQLERAQHPFRARQAQHDAVARRDEERRGEHRQDHGREQRLQERRGTMPAPPASDSSTKPNSPPWASARPTRSAVPVWRRTRATARRSARTCRRAAPRKARAPARTARPPGAGRASCPR